MIVCFHDSVRADVDSENGGEIAQSIDHPNLAVRVVPACQGIQSTQERSADAPGEAMIHAFLTFLDVFAARQSHGSPLFNMSNGELMESAKKKIYKKWVSKFLFCDKS
jgi:hypothetical protein